MSPEKRSADLEAEESAPKKARTVRQGHGLEFEDWIEQTFFESSHLKGPTDHWDFSGVKFKDEVAGELSRFSGLNYSVKTCKEGTSIGLGDVMRQFDNNQDFALIVAFWKKNGSSKEVVSVSSLIVDKTVWHDLFGGITREQITAFDTFVKNNKKEKKTARAEAQEEKKKLPESAMTINPKIDAKVRRVQCSLSYTKFWEVLAKTPPTKTTTLWGRQVPKLK